MLPSEGASGALAFRRSAYGFHRGANASESVKAALHAIECEGVTFAFRPRLSQAPGAPV
jgi:hypothetical protein